MVPKGTGTRAVSGGETKTLSYSTLNPCRKVAHAAAVTAEKRPPFGTYRLGTQEAAAKHWVAAHWSLFLAVIAGSSPRRCLLVTDGPGNQKKSEARECASSTTRNLLMTRVH